MLVEGLYLLLKADSGVQTQLGTPGTRSDQNSGIFPVQAPEECTMPYIVYQQVGADQVISFAGVNRTQEARFRFSCYATTYLGAKNLVKALKNVMNGLLTTLPDSEATPVMGAWLETEDDGVESFTRGTIYADYVDYRIWFTDKG